MEHTVSVVVSAYNEQATIERCLASVSWADEIIVVDSGSTDTTAEIAGKFTKKIYPRPNNLMLNRNKNFGFEKATCEWILNLDADEVIPDDLKNEILAVINKQQTLNGYWLSRKNIIFGKWISHGFWWPDKQLRLFKRGRGKFPCRYIHEYIKVDGPSGELAHPYVHYNYESVSQYIRKLDRCTTSESRELLADGYQFQWSDALVFPTRDFLKIYFSQLAYKDGLHGLALSMLQAFYSFVTFAKIWEREGFSEPGITVNDVEKEYKKSMRELTYWQLTTHIEQGKNPLRVFIDKIRRRRVRA